MTVVKEAAIEISFRTPLSSCCGRQRIVLCQSGRFFYRRTRWRRGFGWLKIDARDLDDGLPRGLLVGAIVHMRLTHRLDWARELLRRRGEELPRDVGSELRCLEVPTGRRFPASDPCRECASRLGSSTTSRPSQRFATPWCRSRHRARRRTRPCRGVAGAPRRGPPSNDELRVGIRPVGLVLHVRPVAQQGFNSGGSVTLVAFGR